MTTAEQSAVINWQRFTCGECGGMLEALDEFAHCPKCYGKLIPLARDELEQLRGYHAKDSLQMTTAKAKKPRSPRKTARPKTWTCGECSTKNPDEQPYCSDCDNTGFGLLTEEHTLVRAFTATPALKAEWDQLYREGGTDEQLLTTASTATQYHQKLNGLSYFAGETCTVFWDSDDKHLEEGIWLVEDGETVPLGGIPNRNPDFPREHLIKTLRELFHIQEPAEQEENGPVDESSSTPAKTGQKPGRTVAKKKPAFALPPPTNDRTDERRVPIDQIYVPKGANPRTEFDKEELAELAQSIKELDVLQPLVVRERAGQVKLIWELLAGERRLRAAKLAKLETVPIVVRQVDNQTAAIIRLEENLKRVDLNPIDKARALQTLMDQHGFSQRDLADRYDKLSQGVVGNAVRLLKLPKAWQQRVISQEITATQARELATWHDLPAVLKEMAEFLKEDYSDKTPPHPDAWERSLIGALRDSSRQMNGTFYRRDAKGYGGQHVKVALTKTEKQREDLDVREVPTWSGKEKRAFNVKLWDELQAAGEERRAQRQQRKEKSQNDQSTTSKKTKLTGAEAREKAKQQKEAWQKKLTRYYFGWLQREVIAALESQLTMSDAIWDKLVVWFAIQPGPDVRGRELMAVLKECGGKERQFGQSWYRRPDAWGSMDTLKHISMCQEVLQRACLHWLSHNFEGYNADVQPHMLAGLAGELGITLKTHWQCDRDFLELHTMDQLAALAKEWKTNVYTGKRKDVVDALAGHSTEMTAAGKPLPAPKALLAIAKKPAKL